MLIVRPEAEHDIAEAAKGYEQQRTELSLRFRAALDATFTAIAQTNGSTTLHRSRRDLLRSRSDVRPNQSTAPRKVGVILNATPAKVLLQYDALRTRLRELGWVEGRSIAFEPRWANDDPERLPGLVAELVQANVDIIVVSGTPAILAAQRGTRSLPVAFLVLSNPVSAGFVTSLARPGGNMTGLASHFEELISKQLQLLKEAIADLSRVALLHHFQTLQTIISAAATPREALAWRK